MNRIQEVAERCHGEAKILFNSIANFARLAWCTSASIRPYTSSCSTSFLLEGHRNVRVVQQLRECLGTEDTHVHFMYIEAAKVCTKCS